MIPLSVASASGSPKTISPSFGRSSDPSTTRTAIRRNATVRGLRVSGLREIAVPFVAAAPAGARVRARLRVSPEDEAVLRAVGSHLGSLAGRDLAARCAEGRLDAKGKAVSRAW